MNQEGVGTAAPTVHIEALCIDEERVNELSVVRYEPKADLPRAGRFLYWTESDSPVKRNLLLVSNSRFKMSYLEIYRWAMSYAGDIYLDFDCFKWYPPIGAGRVRSKMISWESSHVCVETPKVLQLAIIRALGGR